MQSSLLEQKSQGVIKCAYVPLDVVSIPSLYDEPNKTYERLESLVHAISSDLPENYKQGFKLKLRSEKKMRIAGKIKEEERFMGPRSLRIPITMLTPESEEVIGPVMYTNFDRWDDENGSQIGIGLSILSRIGISGRKEPVYLGAVDTFFSFSTYEDVKALLHTFEKELMLGSNDSTLQPLIQRIDVHGNKLNEGIETLREIFGKGKRGKMLEIGQGYAFENSYST